MNILVCGFMGAGKTTFVKKFESNDLGFIAYDLDHVVADQLGIGHENLGAWINKNTLVKFRNQEIVALEALLNQKTMKIVALGGGTMAAERFHLLRNGAKIIFLDIPFETCFERIQNDLNRPLSALSKEDLRELYLKRLPIYREADLILSEADIKDIEGLKSLVHNLSSV